MVLATMKREAAALVLGMLAGLAAGTKATLAWIHRQQTKSVQVELSPMPAAKAPDGGLVLARRPAAEPFKPGVSRHVQVDLVALRPLSVGDHVSLDLEELRTPQGLRHEVKPSEGPLQAVGGLDEVGPMPAGSGPALRSWGVSVAYGWREGASAGLQRSWGPWTLGIEGTPKTREVRVRAVFTW